MLSTIWVLPKQTNKSLQNLSSGLRLNLLLKDQNVAYLMELSEPVKRGHWLDSRTDPNRYAILWSAQKIVISCERFRRAFMT